MIHLQPVLAIKRLVISSQGRIVYDHSFHYGVNIIRGQNGSGKSTICDFLFYVLGGDVQKLKPEAERCDIVIAEIEIDRKAITLKRAANRLGQPIWIFWGKFEDAMKSITEGWHVYSIKRSQSRESFSQVIFRALNFPEVRSDTASNITMHQVLRLLYVDQLSAVDSLMRDEQFDTAVTRDTVGDLLLGIYDDRLYRDLLDLRESQKSKDSLAEQLKALERVLEATSRFETDPKALEEQISGLKSELQTITEKIETIVSGQISKADEAQQKKNASTLVTELRRGRKLIAELKDEIERSRLDILDSQEFIADLKARLTALDESISTRRVIGDLPLTHCPQCLTPITKEVTENQCVLCHNELPKTPTDGQALRMRQELAQQIIESEHLLAKKEQTLRAAERQLPVAVSVVELQQREFNDFTSQVRSDRDTVLDQLIFQKGKITSQIVSLEQDSAVISLFASLQKELADADSFIGRLNLDIKRRREEQIRNRQMAHDVIARYGVDLLHKDLSRQDEFPLAGYVSVDFTKNTFAVDGRNHFAASSTVYLKNSVHFAIFFASLELGFMRYPRFILCDNMEDKGMEAERSQNFQRLIVAQSKRAKAEHQIIFTTSMIDPALNSPTFCIGPEYTKQRKTLNFSS